jgi:CRP-like cAMP-binding protein
VRLVRIDHVVRPDGSVQLGLALTHQDMADAIVSSRESVTRLLAGLAREGIVRRDRGWVTIPAGSSLLQALRSGDDSTGS